MKNVGLCICWEVSNFGSTLQAFATTFTLGKIGIDFEIIRYKKRKSFFIKSLPRLLNKYLLEDKRKFLISKINLLFRPNYKEYCRKWADNFQSFRKEKFVPYLSKIYDGYENLKIGSLNYRMVVVGSDQLWSPSGLPTNFYNLMFVAKEIPKISYASSFGCPSIPWYQEKRTKIFLNRFSAISVRENTGAKIVKKLIDRDVPVVVDPTLLLTKEEWLRQIPDEFLIEKPYIFAYFLGMNKDHRKIVAEFGKKINMPIVTIHHCDHYNKADLGFGDIVRDDIGPEKFVNLIRHADYVCTDSFHGSVFSLLHHKQFITFNRYNANVLVSKNTRIDSLFQNLGLEKRRYNGTLFNEISQSIDYNSVDMKLNKWRKSSFDYLKLAFSSLERE